MNEILKPTDLMIGDIVMAVREDEDDDIPVLKRPVRITGITEFTGLGINGDCKFEFDYLCQEDIKLFEECDYFEPIPLIEEILKKNGFKCFKSDIELHPYYYIEHKFSMKCAINGDGHFYLDCIGADVRIRYVHELQHILRLCGLNELSDNFRVE